MKSQPAESSLPCSNEEDFILTEITDTWKRTASLCRRLLRAKGERTSRTERQIYRPDRTFSIHSLNPCSGCWSCSKTEPHHSPAVPSCDYAHSFSQLRPRCPILKATATAPLLSRGSGTIQPKEIGIVTCGRASIDICRIKKPFSGICKPELRLRDHLRSRGICPVCNFPRHQHCEVIDLIGEESLAKPEVIVGISESLQDQTTGPKLLPQSVNSVARSECSVSGVFHSQRSSTPGLRVGTTPSSAQDMALSTSSPSLSANLTQHNEQYPSESSRRPYPTTPQHNSGYASQPSSGATVRQTAQGSPNPQTHGRMLTDGYDTTRTGGSSVQPPPRTSSNQQRSQSVALATDAQLADRTRSRGSSTGPSAAGGRVAQTESSHASPGASAARPEASRGVSQVINRVVVDDPKNDIHREQVRVAEGYPDAEPAKHVSMPPAVNTADTAKPMKRQDFSATANKRKEARLGDYILGQTLGEGEFGKVKLGWKKDGSVQVAVKLIRRENLNTNPGRLPKIYREISILGQLSHPNIVKLHEMVETERYIGIILEYASGGELFDYILTHRYLKDNAARRLFAQLVSGVGYLHKKGIVHRDLKLENLLLDRNRNLMISDFGFANTFDPRDELGEEIETRITDKEFVKRRDLEKVHRNGFRRGDLMQTSCGSPCYAAPELVVSDSLYTGRKVDVWSCGVILYAMLAGYLPFDDDPANPEGDNINLLYKYICNTPLTFPEYVTPHARDLLRRILVPDPRKRADLFEVARHSWLSEYAHVVEHITSTTTTIDDIGTSAPVSAVAGKSASSRAKDNILIPPIDTQAPHLARSASVREPSKPPGQGSAAQQSKAESQADKASSPRDPKRRTVQLEYVAPPTHTARGEASPTGAQETIGIPSTMSVGQSKNTYEKPLPQDPPVDQATVASSGYQQRSTLPAPTRPVRETRAASDYPAAYVQSPTRPTTGNSLSSNSAGRMPSRGNSYSQPLAPTVAATSAAGRIQQPKSRQYNISVPVPQPEPYISDNAPRPVSQRMPLVKKPRQSAHGPPDGGKGHKRSTTLGNIFSRHSIFGSSKTGGSNENSRSDRRYPPTSMKAPLPVEGSSPRGSSDSRTRPSLSISRKNSGSDVSNKPEKNRRFSLLPPSFSLKNFAGSSNTKDGLDRAPQRGATSSGPPTGSLESMVYPGSQPIPPRTAPHQQQSDAYGTGGSLDNYSSQPIPASRSGVRPTSERQHSASGYIYGTSAPAEAQLSTSYSATSRLPQSVTSPQISQAQEYRFGGQPDGRYPAGFNEYDDAQSPGGRAGGTLPKTNRRFADGYEDIGHGGSSGAARRVMDFFRRRGKARAGEIQ